jgi:hypothetical protein
MQHFEKCNARDALKRRNENSSWDGAPKRLTPETWPAITPSFKVKSGAKVFTMGSCFARNIEEQLALLGFDLPTLAFSVPDNEWPGLRKNGILNKYTPAAVYQEIHWASEIFKRGDGFIPSDADQMRFDMADGQVVDLHLGGLVPVTAERFIERRKDIYDVYAHVFSSDLIALTFGLTESWSEIKTGLHIHQPPASRQLIRKAADYEFVNLDYEACLDYMRRTVAILKDLNPNASIIVTTSPVPLNATFTEQDVIVANMLSKSTLRSALGKLAIETENLDYFPSYESVMLSPTQAAFEDDLRHIRDGFVGKIVKRLTSHYFDITDVTASLVQEAAVALGTPGSEKDCPAFVALEKHNPPVDTLTDDQLNVYLRNSWRVGNRRKVRRIAKEIMQRAPRIHRHLRGIAHIFPKCKLEAELEIYAKDVLAIDPNSKLARRCLGLDETGVLKPT